jgi:hypothetical protein
MPFHCTGNDTKVGWRDLRGQARPATFRHVAWTARRPMPDVRGRAANVIASMVL